MRPLHIPPALYMAIWLLGTISFLYIGATTSSRPLVALPFVALFSLGLAVVPYAASRFGIAHHSRLLQGDLSPRGRAKREEELRFFERERQRWESFWVRLLLALRLARR